MSRPRDSVAERARRSAVPLGDRDLPASTYELLAHTARRCPAAPALHLLPAGSAWRHATTWSYDELLRRVHRAANLYASLGARPADVVAILLPNTPAAYPAFLGAQAIGIANPVNPALGTDHVADILRLTGARILVAPAPALDPEGWLKACELATTVRSISAVVTVGGAVPDPPPWWAGDFDQLCVAQPDDALSFTHRPQPTDIAAYFHTGGTTGTPKVAPHTHQAEVYVAWAMGTHDAFGGDVVVLSGLPLFHVNAILISTLAPFLLGGTAVTLGPLGFRDRAAVADFWQIVEHYRVSTFSTVPTVYASLPAVPEGVDISSLRAGIVGAAPLPDRVRTEFEAGTGVPMVEGYGLTEGTCASAFSPLSERRVGSVGPPLPYQRIKAVRMDENGMPGADCTIGETGMLMIAGTAVFPGYLRRGEQGPAPDPTGVVEDGWLLTGDLGRVDADGYVYLTGRAKDIIIRGGHNIDPRQIEDALLLHPEVTAAAAVGRPDAHAGEVPAAYVVLEENSTASERELQAWAADHCAEPASVPRVVQIVAALPLTSVGKIDKVSLVHDSVRQVVQEVLDGVGLIGAVIVADHDGRTRATIHAVGSGDASDQATELLSRYSFDHAFASA